MTQTFNSARIAIPAPEAAPKASRPMLEAIAAQIGMVPNGYRMFANSPPVLGGILAMQKSLRGGELDPKLQELIAIAVANVNGCDYCHAAHVGIAKRMGAGDAEVSDAVDGRSDDALIAPVLAFARAMTATRGEIGDADIEALRDVGWSDGAMVEIVAHVAVNTLTNYANEAFRPEIDVPPAGRAKRFSS